MQRCTNLSLARDRKSHTDAEVVPSDEGGHGVSLAGWPGTAVAIKRKLDQPLTPRGAVGGPPRKAVGQCRRSVQERVRSWVYLEPNAPGGIGGGIDGAAPEAPPGECAV